MTQSAEQFLASAKTAVDDFSGAATTGLAGLEMLVALNLATAKTALADAAELAQAGFSAKAVPDQLALAGFLQPMVEKTVAYGRSVSTIVTETGAALSKVAESKFASAQAQTVASIQQALKQAPGGSDATVAAFNTAVEVSQKALATAQATAKQAGEAFEKNVVLATDMAVATTTKTAKAK